MPNDPAPSTQLQTDAATFHETGDLLKVMDKRESDAREVLSCHDQMLDAQSKCVPCSLCGSSAIISDAGIGAGYYIRCSGQNRFRPSKGCMIDHQRLSGWAYNVMEWWNRLHTRPAPDLEAVKEACAKVCEEIGRQWGIRRTELFKAGNEGPWLSQPDSYDFATAIRSLNLSALSCAGEGK